VIAPDVEVIGFDADDTLWHSEDGFRANEERFVELVAPYAPEGVDIRAALTATERKNLHAFGYGVKSFGLSMVEAAVTITEGAVPSPVVAQLVALVRAQLQEPVRLLPHVPEVLSRVGAAYRLVLVTKGDLIHQSHKIATSGLGHHFEHVEIVLEKDPETYARVLRQVGVEPGRFCMVGNSVRSDVLPVMALGGHAVHVPYPLLWELERVEHDEHVVELASLDDLPGWLGL
jgi:putative hydrolase of the HAD superfamily